MIYKNLIPQRVTSNLLRGGSYVLATQFKMNEGAKTLEPIILL